MSHVDWTDQALDDMREVVKDPKIIIALMCVGWTELRERPSPDDDDEGEGRDGLLWRRGILRGTRETLDPTDLDLDEDYRAWDYVLVYRMRNLTERRRHFRKGFVVLRVISNTQLYGAYLQGLEDED